MIIHYGKYFESHAIEMYFSSWPFNILLLPLVMKVLERYILVTFYDETLFIKPLSFPPLIYCQKS